MPDQDNDFLATARRRFDAAAEEEHDLREKFASDLKFASPDGEDQWDPTLKLQRQQAGRPAMAFPRCHIFVAQVANDARDKKPQIKFAPQHDIDKDTAEVYEGMARYIQYSSDAQRAYDTAIEYSAGASFGYYRFLTDYVDDESEEQELKVVTVQDPLTVYGILVPTCFNRKPMWGFVIEDMAKEEFKAQYPKTEMSSLSWVDAEKRAGGWVGDSHVRIAEYWYCEKVEGGSRRRPKYKVKCCKINGLEILPDSETEWLGSSIPIVPVLGKQLVMDGKPQLYSVVRPQKAAQQLINYSKSRIAETLSTSPISPFIVANGQIAGFEAEWKTLNTQNRPFLTYNQIDNMGKPAPPPQRQTFEPPIQSLSAFVAQEIQDMKDTTGIFDASLGSSGNEVSGQAILRRQQQTNLATMHFMDNLLRSFRQGGEIIEEMIPLVYTEKREVTILGADETAKTVMINAPHSNEAGVQKHFKIADAKVKLVVTSGKAYDSKRAETFDTISQVVQTSPQMFPIVGDIMFRNSDMAGADQVAERLHKMLPPQLQEDPNNPLPPQAQAAVAQAHQQVQAIQGEMQKLLFQQQAKTQEIQGKMQQIQLQHQADMQLEDKKLAVQVAVAEVTTKAQNEQERQLFIQDVVKEVLKQHGSMTAQGHDQAHSLAMQAHKQVHERGMAQQAQAAAVEQAQQPANQEDAVQ